jgi:hypothetical protein
MIEPFACKNGIITQLCHKETFLHVFIGQFFLIEICIQHISIMSLDEEEQRTLDLCAEKLRDLLEAELNSEVGEEPTANPQLYLENLLRRFSPWEKPEICK